MVGLARSGSSATTGGGGRLKKMEVGMSVSRKVFDEMSRRKCYVLGFI